MKPLFYAAVFAKNQESSWVAADASGEWQPSANSFRGENLDIPAPDRASVLRLHLIGVFGRTIRIQCLSSRAVLPPFKLWKGKHYGAPNCAPGDGVVGETIGAAEAGKVVHLSLDLPSETVLDSIRVSGNFELFDGGFEIARACPFSARGAGVSLAEVGVAVRVGDRVCVTRALDQLFGSAKSQPIDEARGSVLLFLAVVAAAQLEAGSRKPLHRFQLEAARRLDRARAVEQVIAAARELTQELLGDLLEERAPTDLLINRALSLVERGYGRPLSDEGVAAQLSLSTSHFRHLFKQATGQPFHQYLIALRLERARAMLTEQGIPVAEVARSVGFMSPAHFSRAFQRRFGIAPNAIRHGLRTTPS